MPCFRPLKGYRSRERNSSGKRSIVFNYAQGFKDLEVELPCSQCIGCKLEHSRKWAVRMVHESMLYDANSFITLTYNDEHLPLGLNKKHFQDFMKRLRKRFDGHSIRYFHCGEYGEQTNRPHYHACLFNFDFPDKEYLKTVNGNRYYTSKILEELWGMGNVMIGALTFESAAYVARYITKKITGRQAYASGIYEIVNYETGEVYEKQPEYATMSRRPGIGKAFFDKFKDDFYPSDFVVIRGKKMAVPKFYDGQYELISPDEMARIKAKRKAGAAAHSENNTHERLIVREECQLRKMEQLERKYEKNE